MSRGGDGVTRISMWSGPRNISTTMMYSFAQRADTVVVDELLAALDEALLLDNVRARTAQQAVLHAYRAAPHRPLLLAERGYPGDPAALRAMFDALLAAADVGTRPPADWPEWSGLLSPHIDYPRGGHVYAQVWKHAAEAARVQRRLDAATAAPRRAGG